MTRPDAVPGDAERLALFDHFTSRRAPSKLVPGAEQLIPFFDCPSCDTEMPTPYAPSMCPGCGLRMLADGSGLFIWRAQAAAQVA